MSDQIHCPKCNSTQLSANKKGFSGGKAAAGAILVGGIGLLAGTHGSNNIIITCLSCGNQFKPGEKAKTPVKITQKSLNGAGNISMVFGVLFSLLGVIIFFSASYIFGGILLLIGIFLISVYYSNQKIIRQMQEDENMKRTSIEGE